VRGSIRDAHIRWAMGGRQRLKYKNNDGRAQANPKNQPGRAEMAEMAEMTRNLHCGHLDC